MHPMNYSIATNWDLGLLEKLEGTSVTGLYGQIWGDPLGGGRRRYEESEIRCGPGLLRPPVRGRRIGQGEGEKRGPDVRPRRLLWDRYQG